MVSRKTISMIIVSIMLLALASAGIAQGPLGPKGAGGPDGPRGRGPGGDLLRMREYLGLTEQQVSSMEALLEKHRAAAQPLVEEMRAKREALRAALDAAESNPTMVGQAVIAERALGKQLRALNEKLHTDMLAILTDEQKEKLLTRGPGGRGPRRGGPM